MKDIISKLLALGATYSLRPEVYPSRPKVSGRMWGGECRLLLNGDEYCFILWHHGHNVETLESLLQYFSLKGIKSDKCGYDTYWHSIIIPAGILTCKDGWFRNIVLREKVEAAGTNIDQLLKLGLFWLVKFN